MFNGWYFKISDRKISLAIIVGVSENMAFIQTIDTYTNQSQMIEYDINDFEYTKNPFLIRIKDNYFTYKRITLNLDNNKIKIRGVLENNTFTNLNTSIYAPSIMGPFYYLKKMECNHDIISLSHQVTGKLMINQQKITIKGQGYIERDWGYSFPSSYLWLQSNDCHQPNTMIFLAIAKIPILKTSFTGIIMVLMLEGKQQKIASYYGAYLKKYVIKNNNYYLIIKQQAYTFYLKITTGNTSKLKAPQLGTMNNTIKESLDAKARIVVYKNKQKLYKLNFIACGLELVE